MLKEITFNTSSAVEFIDITSRVKEVVRASGVRNGLVTVSSCHTTAAVKINERCERLQSDMMALLERTVPAANYRHDEDTIDSRANARSHLMSLLLSASENVPLSNGKLVLGTWQSIFFIELDGPRSKRSVVVSVVGNGGEK